jgi:hypothetical protein
MARKLVAAAIALLVGTGCSGPTFETQPGVLAAPPPGVGDAIVPTGTQLVAELDETLTTKSNKVGDRFTVTVKDDVMLDNAVVVPQGSKITGRITGIDDSDRIGDQAAIRVVFESITINNASHAFSAEVTEVDVDLTDRVRTGDVTEKAAIGAAAGAVLGAVIGGGLKDILVGGALGAGAGTIISLGMGDVEAALPKGADLTLRVTQRVS